MTLQIVTSFEGICKELPHVIEELFYIFVLSACDLTFK